MTDCKATRKAPLRVAVAEGDANQALALGRAVRFVVFDIVAGEARGPCYRVRHDQPGESCDGHAELTALLHDCQLVIAGAAGARLTQRLRARGIEVATTPDELPAAVLVARYLVATRPRAGSSQEFNPETMAPGSPI